VSAEKGSAGAYYNPPAMDGSRPATFYANLRDTSEMPTWGMKTLAYHEGIPGHHFQIATAHDLKGLPLIRQQPIYSAYSEGWALYAERLAAEIGLYRDDPFGDLGRLQAEMFRAVRLVVDTGIHAKGWSREQAIDYMVQTTGMNAEEVVSEVERYMALPGQACAYKVGQLKLLELRDQLLGRVAGVFAEQPVEERGAAVEQHQREDERPLAAVHRVEPDAAQGNERVEQRADPQVALAVGVGDLALLRVVHRIGFHDGSRL